MTFRFHILVLGFALLSHVDFLSVHGRNNNITKSGKTYFLQLKNVGDGEFVYRPLWRKHLKTKQGKSAEEYEILGRLIQAVSYCTFYCLIRFLILLSSCFPNRAFTNSNNNMFVQFRDIWTACLIFKLWGMWSLKDG